MKRRYTSVILLAVIVIIFFSCKASKESKIGVTDSDVVFVRVEQPAEFVGGADLLQAYLKENIVYPQKARENKIEGKVYVSFIVEKDGSLSNIKVLRDIGYGCGEEAVRVMKNMTKWKPGRQKGKPVRMQYVQPITFQL